MRIRTAAVRSWCIVAVGSLCLAGCQTLKRNGQGEAAARPQSAAVTITNTLSITALPVGSGMCHLAVCPGTDAAGYEDALVVDCGTSNRGPKDWTEPQVASYLAPRIAGRRVTVVLSHGDRDHHSYIARLFPNGTGVSALYFGNQRSDYGAGTEKWINQVAARGVPVHGEGAISIGPGPSCGAASTEILAVNTTPGNKNASSLVLGMGYAGHRAILPGDATGATEQAVIDHYGPHLHVSLLEASHHGSESEGSNNAAWAAATSPSNLIVSAGPIGHYGHPRCDAIARYDSYLAPAAVHIEHCVNAMGVDTFQSNRTLYNTEDDGPLTFTIGNSAFSATQIVSPGRP